MLRRANCVGNLFGITCAMPIGPFASDPGRYSVADALWFVRKRGIFTFQSRGVVANARFFNGHFVAWRLIKAITTVEISS